LLPRAPRQPQPPSSLARFKQRVQPADDYF